MILGGLDSGKDMDLQYVNGRLTGADEVGGGSVGLLMSKAVSRRWRLALTYRISCEPLGGDADVTQLSIELDAHLMLRGFGHAGPYIGLGVGMLSLHGILRTTSTTPPTSRFQRTRGPRCATGEWC